MSHLHSDFLPPQSLPIQKQASKSSISLSFSKASVQTFKYYEKVSNAQVKHSTMLEQEHTPRPVTFQKPRPI